MAVYTQVSAEALAAFLAHYDVGAALAHCGIAQGIENTNFRVDTTVGRFVLTLYERRVDERDLPYFVALMNFLAERGVPAPRVIADRSGATIGLCAGRPACLQTFQPGDWPRTPSVEQAKAAGGALAEMHDALGNFSERRENTLDPAGWQRLFDRCGDDLDLIAPGLRQRIAVALDEVVARWPDALPVGTIHADLFPDNVLVEGEQVSGLIDFYFACNDIIAYDLAVMHTAWMFDAADRPRPEIGRALVIGYEARRPLAFHERTALPVLAQGACLRFALTRAWDWLNTPPGLIGARKDPLAYLERLDWYAAHPEAFA